MKPIGIIANPWSGKDIRRLVTSGSVVSNNEKANMIRRILQGLDSTGVNETVIMRDSSGIGARAMDHLDLSMEVNYLDHPMTDNQDDSTLAARIMDEKGVACIIVLGGDGTNRVVAKGAGQTPLLSVSTGTNNAFCEMLEGTLVGMAAGVLASGAVDREAVCKQMPSLEVWKGDYLLDIALVDLVISSANYIGSRAIWEEDALEEVFLTRAEPGHIGFSYLGGHLRPLRPDEPRGMHIIVGEGDDDQRVMAPIAPGLVRWVSIKQYRLIEAGAFVKITPRQLSVALDGEREHVLTQRDTISVTYNPQGPFVVNPTQALEIASESGFFIKRPAGPTSKVFVDNEPTPVWFKK